MKRTPPALALFSLLAGVSAQDPTLEARGGGIGNPLGYAVRGGKANQGFILAPSLQRASIPLKFLDGIETRSLSVGFDLAAFWLFGRLDGTGGWSAAVPVPNDPGLVGINVLHQAVTWPGTGGRALDGISEVVVVPVDHAGVFKSQAAKLSAPRQFATNIPLPDGRVLLVGGGGGVILWQNALQATEIFDPATRSFSRGPDLVQARTSHTQTLLDDGRYLLVGGVDAKNVATATCEVFDPKTGRFAAVGSLTYKRTYHQAVRMADGRVVVIGGFADMGAILGPQQALESGIRQTEIFDPKTGTWTVGPSLGSGRGAPGAEDLGNGRILVIGGVVKGTFYPDLSLTCELYDTKTHTVSPAASIPVRTAFMTTFRLPGNRVLVAGGDAGPRDAIRNYLNIATNRCLIYAAASNTWTTISPLPVATSGGDAITLRDGTLVLAGGGDNTLYWPHGNKGIYAFDPANNRWNTLGTLVEGRNSGETVELQSGALVVIGGGVGNAARSTDTWELMVR